MFKKNLKSFFCKKCYGSSPFRGEDAQATSGPPPIFANKVLLEHSQAHSFTYGLWLTLHSSCRTK